MASVSWDAYTSGLPTFEDTLTSQGYSLQDNDGTPTWYYTNEDGDYTRANQGEIDRLREDQYAASIDPTAHGWGQLPYDRQYINETYGVDFGTQDQYADWVFGAGNWDQMIDPNNSARPYYQALNGGGQVYQNQPLSYDPVTGGFEGFMEQAIPIIAGSLLTLGAASPLMGAMGSVAGGATAGGLGGVIASGSVDNPLGTPEGVATGALMGGIGGYTGSLQTASDAVLSGDPFSWGAGDFGDFDPSSIGDEWTSVDATSGLGTGDQFDTAFGQVYGGGGGGFNTVPFSGDIGPAFDYSFDEWTNFDNVIDQSILPDTSGIPGFTGGTGQPTVIPDTYAGQNAVTGAQIDAAFQPGGVFDVTRSTFLPDNADESLFNETNGLDESPYNETVVDESTVTQPDESLYRETGITDEGRQMIAEGIDSPWADPSFAADAAITDPGLRAWQELQLLEGPNGNLAGGDVSMTDYMDEITRAAGGSVGEGGLKMSGSTLSSLKGLSALADILTNANERNKSKTRENELRNVTATYDDNPTDYLDSDLAQAMLDQMNRQMAARNAKLGKTFKLDEGGKIRGSGTGFEDWTGFFQANMGKMYQDEMERRRKKAELESGVQQSVLKDVANEQRLQSQRLRDITGNAIGNAGNIWDLGKSSLGWFESWF